MAFLDIFFPKKCLGCKTPGKYICDSCLVKVPQAYRLCPGCGMASYWGLTHTYCRRKTPLAGLVAIWKYSGVVRRALITLKFNFAADVAGELGIRAAQHLLTNHLTINKLTGIVLVPIPLHHRRENWRGFNQSAVLGKLLAQKMNWGFNPNLLKRVVNTPHQTRLKRVDREKNIQNAFEFVSRHSLKSRLELQKTIRCATKTAISF